MSGAIAIFVKTPGHSPLKSRLAAGIGRGQAEAWYQLAATAVAEVATIAARDSGVSLCWAVAERAGLTHPLWSGLPCIAQSEGGLGTRMQRVHTELVARHGRAVLIGADAPQLTAEHLDQALRWLGVPSPRQVIGAAADGGFWLFGSNRSIPLQQWIEVAYSEPDTLLRFRAAVDNGGAWLVLPCLTDVDRQPDLEACLSELLGLAQATPAQCALISWMRARQAKATAVPTA